MSDDMDIDYYEHGDGGMSMCPACDHSIQDGRTCAVCGETTHEECDPGHNTDAGEWVHDECEPAPVRKPGDTDAVREARMDRMIAQAEQDEASDAQAEARSTSATDKPLGGSLEGGKD